METVHRQIKAGNLRKLQFPHLSIRAKLTLPYVILSLIIALGGGLIVTQVVIDSVEDRFSSQLIETRKLASEIMVREEAGLLETLRLLAYTEGVSQAIEQRDRNRIRELVFPATFNAEEDVVLVLDKDSNVLAALLKSAETGEYEYPEITEKLDTLPFVARLVNQEVDETGDKYSGVSMADWGAYFFVSGPVNNEQGELSGLVLVGKSIDGIAERIREETLCQVTVYDTAFNPISTTFIEFPAAPGVDPARLLGVKEKQSLQRNLEIGDIAYTEVLSAWEIREGENIGILGTSLPKTFVVRTSRITRLNVAWQVILATLAAMLLGILLSRRITQPILRLKNAASQISTGNLNVHLDTYGTDEVAVLAQSFNEMAANLRRSEKNLISAYDKTIEGWVKALELRDRETLGHTLRAASMTLELARRIGIPEAEMPNIRRGVLLHDIGKMGIPDSILLKHGDLDDWERKIIETHPALAREMLNQIEFLRPCIDIPACHHERWDGLGYPNGLAGEQIPLVARLFSIVDVWDALTSQRPYRPAWPNEDALQYIRERSGKDFDPGMVEIFAEMVKKRFYDKNDQKTIPNPYLVRERPNQ